ncbi:hypothetical protein E2C01_024057 [Portunus trituberculatus]|uniref:Uncharacterized protein n=1 Tax=Portunus trituberculatus TaxID=210409 RepID=A0A5B7EBL1_PORTR|nr:hypothetical protein [Portunus trituberculatus]
MVPTKKVSHRALEDIKEIFKLFSITVGCDILQDKAQCIELHHTHDSNTECRSVFLVASRQGGREGWGRGVTSQSPV